MSITEPIMAFSMFHHKDLVIYKTFSGAYFSLPLSKERKERFFLDIPEIVLLLDPLDNQHLPEMQILESKNNQIIGFGLHLIEIDTKEGKPIYTVYCPKLRIYLQMAAPSFAALCKQTLEELAEQDFEFNSLADPIYIELGENGNLLQSLI